MSHASPITPAALEEVNVKLYTAHKHSGTGSLDKFTKQRIALMLAELNQCQDSISLHTKRAREAGFNSSEIDSNRAGTSQDARGAVAVQFAKTLAIHQGSTTPEQLKNKYPEQWQEVRAAGYSDSDIVDIIIHVDMNLLSKK